MKKNATRVEVVRRRSAARPQPPVSVIWYASAISIHHLVARVQRAILSVNISGSPRIASDSWLFTVACLRYGDNVFPDDTSVYYGQLEAPRSQHSSLLLLENGSWYDNVLPEVGFQVDFHHVRNRPVNVVDFQLRFSCLYKTRGSNEGDFITLRSLASP